MQIIFWSGTKSFELAQYVNQFLVWNKKFGPAQNVLGPVKGQGIILIRTKLQTKIIFWYFGSSRHLVTWHGHQEEVVVALLYNYICKVLNALIEFTWDLKYISFMIIYCFFVCFFHLVGLKSNCCAFVNMIFFFREMSWDLLEK